MARKSSTPDTQPQPFNERAHGIVGDMIEAAELALIRNGVCQPTETDMHLTMDYIRQCGSFHEAAQVYMENDGRLASGIFLWRLSQASKAQLRAKYHRNWRICEVQLHWHAHYYFPMYLRTLREVSLKLLHNLPTLTAIDQNGVLRLAMANLPNVLRDVRRERRRRGADWDKLLIDDGVADRRITHIQSQFSDDMLKQYEHRYQVTSKSP